MRYSNAVPVCAGGQAASVNALTTGATVMVYGPEKKKGKEAELDAVEIVVAGNPSMAMRGGEMAHAAGGTKVVFSAVKTRAYIFPNFSAGLRPFSPYDKVTSTPEWRNGRRGGLKIRWSQGREGSTPFSGTTFSMLSPHVNSRSSAGRRSSLTLLTTGTGPRRLNAQTVRPGKVTQPEGLPYLQAQWAELPWGKPGNTNLLIGLLPRANQEIGVPRKHIIS